MDLGRLRLDFPSAHSDVSMMPASPTVLLLINAATDRKTYRDWLSGTPHQSEFIVEEGPFVEPFKNSVDLPDNIDLYSPHIVLLDESTYRASWPQIKVRWRSPVPVFLVILDSADELLAEAVLEAGAADYLVQPQLNGTRLRQTVRTLYQLIQFRQNIKTCERRDVFNQTAIGINQAAKSGRYIRVNQRFCDLLGYSEAELLALTYQDVTHPDDLVSQAEQERRLFEGEKAWTTFEKRYLRKDGDTVWTRVTLSVVRDEYNRLISDIAIVEDISDSRKLKAELRQEQNLLRTLVDTIPDLIFFKNPKGQYLLWNQAFQDFSGYDADRILRSTDADLFSPAAARWIQIHDQQVLTTRSPLRHEERATFPDQTQRSLDTYKVPVTDERGELAGLIGVCRDITNRKAAEEHLNRTTSRLSTLIRNLHAGILVEDEHRQIVLSNQFFCDLFSIDLEPFDLLGVNGAEFAAQSSRIFAHPNEILEQHDALLSARQPAIAEEVLLADGRVLERDYIPIVAGDRFRGHLWQYRDITQRKANEQALLKASQVLKRFSNNLKQLHRLSIQPFSSFAALCKDYLNTGCEVLNFEGGLLSSVCHEKFTIQAVENGLKQLSTGLIYNLNETFCATSIRTRKTVTQKHFGASSIAHNHQLYQASRIESYISTPVFIEGEVYGSLCFFSQQIRQEGFHNHEREIIELMAQSIGKFISSHQIEQQRLNAESALRESEARFRQLAEHIDNVFWILTPTEHRFLYVSPAFEKVWGCPCDVFLQTPQAWYDAIHHCHDAERIAAMQAEGVEYDEEYQIIRPDGTLRWIRDRAFAIYDDSDKPYRLVGIAEDITNLKRQEQALRLIFEGTAAKTGGQFFRSLVRYLAEVLQVKYALITQVISSEEKLVKFLAFWQKDQFGENYELVLQNTPCEQVLKGAAIFHTDQLQSLYPQFQPFADWQVCSYFGVPLLNTNEEVIGHLAVMDDRPMLSEQPRELILKIFAARAGAELERQTYENELQRAWKAADAANVAKSKFLANISHELRTPLNSILGFTQLTLNSTDIDAKSREYLEIVHCSGDHLLSLINGVLELSKIESGKFSLATNPFDLRLLLQNLQQMFSLRAKSKGLDLLFDCAPNVPRYIQTDESKLRQVLINLLNNAVKFTRQGHVSLCVKMSEEGILTASTQQASSNSQPALTNILFTVTDTGSGIAPQELDSLFEPFTQTLSGHNSSEGTGLGLCISQRFVELMGGQIQVETALNQGATFTFSIKALSVAETFFTDDWDAECSYIKGLAPGQPDYRILVVEDQLFNRLLLERILKSVGFNVQSVDNGITAVERAKSWRPHLIWMDIQLPGINGYEATRQIKAAQLSPTPSIIGLTAKTFEEERHRALASGCDDFIRKPFKAMQLFQIMGRHLSIEYVYDTERSPSSGLSPASHLPPAIIHSELVGELQVMPQTWLQSLRQAAIRGSDEQVVRLVADLPDQQSPLATALIYCAQNFQFNSILDILSPE